MFKEISKRKKKKKNKFKENIGLTFFFLHSNVYDSYQKYLSFSLVLSYVICLAMRRSRKKRNRVKKIRNKRKWIENE